jgi:hypothetical protein
MTRSSKTIATGILSLALMPAALCIHAQTTGTITAQVYDQDGKPLADAAVEFVPTDVILASALPSCLTDADGVCSKDLKFWKYHVIAEKKADGFPDLSFNFYGHGKWPATVTLSPEQAMAHVTVKLGPKAGSLVFTIIDAVTAARIEHVSVTLHPFADPKDFLGTNLGPDFRVLIPADEDVSVEVEAKGYQPWKVPGPVRLASGESKAFTISLHPQ